MPIDHDLIRQRIRDRIESREEWSVRNVSIAAIGSDSALHKFLTGANDSIRLANLASIADALDLPLERLLFDRPTAVPWISEQQIQQLVVEALDEVQPGMTLSEIRRSVSATLRTQLERVLSGQVASDRPDALNAPGEAARSPAPTKEADQEESHTT